MAVPVVEQQGAYVDHSSGGTNDSFNATLPSSPTEGNTLALCIGTRDGSAKYVQTPTGWTELGRYSDGTGYHVQIIYKTADSGDAASTSWSFDCNNNYTNVDGGMLELSGVGGWGTPGFENENEDGILDYVNDEATLSGITVDNADGLVLAILSAGAAWSKSASTGWTGRTGFGGSDVCKVQTIAPGSGAMGSWSIDIPGHWTSQEYLVLTVEVDPTSGTAYELEGNAGSFSIAGQDADVVVGRDVEAGAGSYSVAGQDADVVVGRDVEAGAGVFSIAGQDAELTKTSPGSYELVALAGDFSIAGQDADAVVGRKVEASAGSFSIAGQDADLDHTSVSAELIAEAGLFSIAGQDASLDYSGAQIIVGPPDTYRIRVQVSDTYRVRAHAADTYVATGARL